MSLSDFITDFKNASEAERNEFIDLILPYVIKNPKFHDEFDNRLILSPLRPIKRISTIETVLGLNDLQEEGQITIPEQLKELANRLEHPLNKSIEHIEIDLPVIPSTTLEHKASALIEHLKEKVRPRNDAVFMNSKEIINFMKSELPEDLRLKEDIRNPRQAKKDILEKAVKLFSGSVFIIRNKSGNKVTGIALKPSVSRRDTYGC
jgi:hypothetical protein